MNNEKYNRDVAFNQKIDRIAAHQQASQARSDAATNGVIEGIKKRGKEDRDILNGVGVQERPSRDRSQQTASNAPSHGGRLSLGRILLFLIAAFLVTLMVLPSTLDTGPNILLSWMSLSFTLIALWKIRKGMVWLALAGSVFYFVTQRL